MPSNILFDRIRRGEIALGLSNMYPASGIIEGFSKGWDFVWIDTQHGEYGYAETLHSMQAAGACGMPTLLRVPSHETGFIGPMADLAPNALMIPMVDTKEQAQAVVRAAHFPPRGNRSYGGRRVIDLDGRDYYKDREMLVVAQVETLESVENAAEIIAVDGIDMLFFGPDDMKARMGLPINTAVNESDRLREAMKRTADAARRAGKWCGCVAVTAPALKMAVELGYQLLVGGADAAFLRTAAADKLKELRSAMEGQKARPVDSKGPTGFYGG
jgi:4-hydroxy-2-oxoheptanedioate aldolase